jgi:hypothetical protein
MPLKGDAKSEYQREYMRRKRAGLPTRKPSAADDDCYDPEIESLLDKKEAEKGSALSFEEIYNILAERRGGVFPGIGAEDWELTLEDYSYAADLIGADCHSPDRRYLKCHEYITCSAQAKIMIAKKWE